MFVADTLKVVVRSLAVTFPGLMLFETTEFFGALPLLAIAVVPPATATNRASVAVTFAYVR